MAIKMPRWKNVPRFFLDETRHVQWRQVKEGVPACYHQYWMAYYNGIHVADFFCGKSHWYAIMFDVGTLRDTNLRRLQLILNGRYSHPNN